MKVACVILNYNDSEHVVVLVDKIRSYSIINHIIIVDNNSTDNSYHLFSQIFKDLVVLKTDHNGGYGYGNNVGIKYAFNELHCDCVIVSNPDVFFTEELIIKFLSVLKTDKSLGVVSAVQKDITGKIVLQSAWKLPTARQYVLSYGLFLKKSKHSFFYNETELFSDALKEVGCIAGSLVCLSKNAFELTNGFDENIFLYCEETALGFRMKNAGLKTAIITNETYSHLHGASISKTFSNVLQRQKLLNVSHHYVLKKYLKPNVFCLFCDFVLRWSKIILLFLAAPFKR